MKQLSKLLFLLLLSAGCWVCAEDAKIITSNDCYKITSNANGSLSVNFASMPGIEITPYSKDLKPVSAIISCTPAPNMPGSFRIVWKGSSTELPVSGKLAVAANKSITIVPEQNMDGVFIDTPIQYVVLPSRSVESVNYMPDAYPPAAKVNLPPENLLLGLAADGNRMLVVASVQPGNALSVYRSSDSGGKAGFRRIDSAMTADGITLAVFDAKNIWHKVKMDGMAADKTSVLDWTPPFDAYWIFEFNECNIPLFYFLRKEPKTFYRPIIGMYQWPLWMQNNQVNLRCDSKVSGVIRGTALIYALEGAPATPYNFMASLYRQSRVQPIELGMQNSTMVMVPKELANSVTNNTCLGLTVVSEIFVKTGTFGQHAEALSRHAENRLGWNTSSEKQTRRFLDWIQQMKTELGNWRKKEKDNPALLKYFAGLDERLTNMDKDLKDALKGKTPEDNIAHSTELAQKIKELVRNNSGTERAPELYELLRSMNYYMALYEVIGYHAGRNLRTIFKSAALDAAGSEEACRYALLIREQIRQLLTIRGSYEILLEQRKAISQQ
ncbi:MAG: hypothetical protein ACYC4Q_04655 [Victivallaceae bacterium]